MDDLPSGTVTLLFTDIEGSTRLLLERGEAYAQLLAEHRRLLRKAFREHGGVEVDTQGDAFFYAFSRASDAVTAAVAAQLALADGELQVRIGIHTGAPMLTGEGYVGIDVHRAARIMAAGHGGQVLVSEATARLTSDDLLRDLGMHRLKDMTAAERLYQVGDRDFPPLHTLDATNLPVASSPLFGRDDEVKDVAALLTNGARLVTLTGPGGTGKTRLALQVASELVGKFRDGVFWVPLADVSDPELVIPEIGKVLGISDADASVLRNREVLLLLDNLEQVVAVGPRLSELLAASPRSRLLVTSRAALRILAEHRYPVEPLPEGTAVELFCERARAAGRSVDPSETVANICRRLDGLPLAIELAAARTRLLEPKLLLARLDRSLPILTTGARDAPERQQTLRATIEWSYELLAPEARRLFDRLSVFSGGATLEAAEAVADAEVDVLDALVEASMVRVTADGRFTMLETLREYASERLAASGVPQEVARRHAHYYADLLERFEEERHQPGPLIDRIVPVAEAANIRAAAGWASSNEDVTLQVRLLSAAVLIFLRGSMSSYRRDLEAALGHLVGEERLRGRAEFGLEFAAYRLGDYEAAMSAGDRAVALAGEANDLRTAAYAQSVLAGTDLSLGRVEDARRHVEQAVESARRSGEGLVVAATSGQLGYVELVAGNYELARSICRQAREALRPYGDTENSAPLAINEAQACLHLGDIDEAERTAKETLELAYATEDIPGQVDCIRILAGVAARREELEVAAQLMGLTERLRSEVGYGIEPAERATHDDVMRRLAELSDDALAEALAAGGRLSVPEVMTD